MEQVDIKGFEDYQITDDGRVWSKKRNKWMKICHNQKGYCLVYLFKDGKNYCKQVHRIVAEAFIDNQDNLPQVNHKDECKTNNTIENLEWCTNEYNHNYGTRNKRVGKKLSVILKGRKPSEQCRLAQIEKMSKKVYQYTKDKQLINEYESATDAAKKNNFNKGTIGDCCRGKIKTYKGYIWKYN